MTPPPFSLVDFINAPYEVRLASDYEQLTGGMVLARRWHQNLCRSSLTNRSASPVRVKEVVLFSGSLPGEDIPFYGEGFQQNGQRGGTLRQPVDIGFVPDRLEYQLPQVEGMLTAYSLVMLSPKEQPHSLLAFTSCRRFSGEFRFGQGVFEVVMDTEGLSLGPGETWEFEEFFIESGFDGEVLFDHLAEQIEINHPRLVYPAVPSGWCSWYHFGPDITEEAVMCNLDAIARAGLELKFIQIDDGYQSFMGDWLAPGEKFPHGVQSLCHEIRRRGFEPAIWVAPFIAEPGSAIFRQHPEWFVTGADGLPIAAEQVSYGGWRCTPWYVLDGTHPGVQEYFRQVFRTMRTEWGCTYFKLDASFWGAMHGCNHFDPAATRIEAYRRGMAAVLEGAGDAFVLGCNTPVWGSLGLLHGNRVTNDIMRYWGKFKAVALELFHRNWQNNRLWINDPDCLVLNNIQGSSLTADEFRFHIAMIQASGGMILSGDDLTTLTGEQLDVIRRLLPSSGCAARFLGDGFTAGIQDNPGGRLLYCFNWEDQPARIAVSLPIPGRVVDFWSGEDLGTWQGVFSPPVLAPHAARVFKLLSV